MQQSPLAAPAAEVKRSHQPQVTGPITWAAGSAAFIAEAYSTVRVHRPS